MSGLANEKMRKEAEIIGGFKELVAQKKAEAYAKNPQ
jgi:hypothetical protein